MRSNNSFASLIFIVLCIIGAIVAFVFYGAGAYWQMLWTAIATIIIASFVSSSIKIADQWEKAVVLRLGHFRSLNGPGLFFIIPIIDAIPYWIDTRVITMTFKAEKTLTKDTVPVDVDAVLFWKVINPKMAALEVADIILQSHGRHRQLCVM